MSMKFFKRKKTSYLFIKFLHENEGRKEIRNKGKLVILKGLKTCQINLIYLKVDHLRVMLSGKGHVSRTTDVVSQLLPYLQFPITTERPQEGVQEIFLNILLHDI